MKRYDSLPDGELDIMQIIWDQDPPVSRSVIEDRINRTKRLAPTTILTFLTRLCNRGFLCVERRGRTNYYTPLVTRKEYLAGESRRLLDRLYGGSLSAFAVSLSDSGISKEELAELREMLEADKL